MKNTLAPGLATVREVTIDGARTIDFMGEEGRVYATPMLVRDIEFTCRDLLLAHLDDGEDSVGTHIDLDHIAATPLGFRITIEATVTTVNGRAVTLDVNARDEVEPICRCRHGRFVVDLKKTAQRLAEKRSKAGRT